MKRNQIHNIILHIPESVDYRALSDKISQFHVDIIERRLKNLSPEEKLAVIDSIIDRLKAREQNGIIP